jgi:hypothetical protein
MKSKNTRDRVPTDSDQPLFDKEFGTSRKPKPRRENPYRGKQRYDMDSQPICADAGWDEG